MSRLPPILLRIGGAAVLCVPTAAQTHEPLEILENRIISRFVRWPKTAEIRKLRSELQQDGSWPGIDYASRSKANWQAQAHLFRLVTMCQSYTHHRSSFHKNPGLLEDICRAMDCWIARDPTSLNWWYNDIRVPQVMGQCALLMKDHLPPERKEALANILKRGYNYRAKSPVGQNAMDCAKNSLNYGVFIEDREVLKESVRFLHASVVMGNIQSDFSFHQHGPQPYMQGYGSEYFSHSLHWASFLEGTGFDFPEEKRRLLADFLLDGYRWVNRGPVFDHTLAGRNPGGKRGRIMRDWAVGISRLLPGYRTQELNRIIACGDHANQTGRVDPALAHTGAKHFWRSDFTAWHRPECYISVKTSSTRTFQPEAGLGQGVNNLHLADGVTLIMRNGDEYDGAPGIWNGRKLPGTTTEQGNYRLYPRQSPVWKKGQPKPRDNWGPTKDWGTRGTTDFAGGTAEGNYAAAAFHYNRGNVAVKKSWFFFDESCVALGADIDAPDSTFPVETTINQCIRRGPITWGDVNGINLLTDGELAPTGLRWLHHDGIGYFLVSPSEKTVIRAAPQANKEIFTLTLPHGTACRGGKYAYVIVPGIAADRMEGYHCSLAIPRNDSAIQAVYQAEKGILQAVFHEPGMLIWNGHSLSSDQACIVLFQFSADALRFHAASPQAKAMTVRLTATTPENRPWFRELPDSVSCSVSLGLPGGNKAGSTVGTTITRNEVLSN